MRGAESHKGAAGEFYAAARISEFGWSVGLLPSGTYRYDLLAYRDGRTDAGDCRQIQVKASEGGQYRGLAVSKSGPRRARPTEWFVLVDLPGRGDRLLKLYCVPAHLIYVFAWAGWTAHESSPEAGPAPLRFSDFAAYENRFDLLDRSNATEVEWDMAETGAFWRWLPKAQDLSRQSSLMVPDGPKRLPPLP